MQRPLKMGEILFPTANEAIFIVNYYNTKKRVWMIKRRHNS